MPTNYSAGYEYLTRCCSRFGLFVEVRMAIPRARQSHKHEAQTAIVRAFVPVLKTRDTQATFVTKGKLPKNFTANSELLSLSACACAEQLSNPSNAFDRLYPQRPAAQAEALEPWYRNAPPHLMLRFPPFHRSERKASKAVLSTRFEICRILSEKTTPAGNKKWPPPLWGLLAASGCLVTGTALAKINKRLETESSGIALGVRLF